MASTIVDIAKRAGVGESTVVRALRGKGYVSPDTRAKIMKAAEELNYQPNHIARSLVLGKSDLIGIVASSGDIQTFGPSLESIDRGIREAGYSMLFYVSTSAVKDSEMNIFREIIGKRVAGAVIIPSSLTSDPKPYRMLLENGIKLVITDRCIPGIETPQLVFDHYASARMAAEHLISLGHKKIAYLGIPQTSYVGTERKRGFDEALKCAGIKPSDSVFMETDYTERAGYENTKKLLEDKNRPTAIIARHDIVAVGVMEALFDAGISIPGDISLMGQGDTNFSHALRVPLTTTHNPNDRLAEEGVKTLIDMLSGREVENATRMLDVNLVVRSSTAPPKIG